MVWVGTRDVVEGVGAGGEDGAGWGARGGMGHGRGGEEGVRGYAAHLFLEFLGFGDLWLGLGEFGGG